MINNNIFTIKPSLDAAKTSSSIYRNKAFKSIEHIINKVSSALEFDSGHIINKLDEIKKYSVSANLYAFNSKLVHLLINKHDLSGVKSSLVSFYNLPVDEFIYQKPKIVNLDRYDWAIDFAKETVIEANEINGSGYAEMRPISPNQLLANKKTIKKAYSIIKSLSTISFFHELAYFLSHIVLFEGRGISGGSSARAMGSVFIRIPTSLKHLTIQDKSATLIHLTPLVYFLEQLAHEVAHLYLDQLMEMDPLILNKNNDRYESPIRKDKRPMRGVFHATFVLARLYMLFTNIDGLKGRDELARMKRLTTLASSLKYGLMTIKQHAILTPTGNKIYIEMDQLINKG